MERAIVFWSEALDYRPREEPDDDWAVLVPREGDPGDDPRANGPQLALKLVESPKPRRHHLDLYADDLPAEIERLLALGATRVDDWDYEGDADYTVLHDPDGNPFCVSRKTLAEQAEQLERGRQR